jgi:CheY-like chemotaxis protein
VRVTVRDSGAGIEPEFLPRVFERFTQADASTTRKHGGLGIGLALVRHLIELHGGTVSAFSEGLGKGAMFVIDLPLPSARAALDNLPVLVGGAAQDAPLAGVDVCALDDDPDARDIIAVALRRAGATVRSAASGAELIAMLDADLPAKRPDVMLLDLAMPGEDGFGVLAKVRALEQRKGMSIDDAIPAIAVTAFAELSRVRIVEAGFIERVAKPFDPGALVNTIMRVLGNRAARTGGAMRARA